MQDNAGITNALKELVKEIKHQNKILESIRKEIEDQNKNYIYKVIPTYKPEPIDPLNPYKITCDTATKTQPYYGTKVDTSVYGTEWTNKDSLEVVD